MKVFLIIFSLLYLTQTVTSTHHDIDIPKSILKRIKQSDKTNNEWEFDQKVLQNLNYIIEIVESKWKNKYMTSNPIKEEPATSTINPTTSEAVETTARQTPSPQAIIHPETVDNKEYLVCPDPWPFHDIVPVDDQPCEDNSECPTGKRCCRLFNSQYCLEPLDSKLKEGDCPPLTPFEPIRPPTPCQVDYNGCQFDSQCEGSSKCCPGDCHYHQCTVPITKSSITRIPTTAMKAPSTKTKASTTMTEAQTTTTEVPTTTTESQTTTRKLNNPRRASLRLTRKHGSVLGRARVLNSEAGTFH